MACLVLALVYLVAKAVRRWKFVVSGDQWA